jgi:hypothetical protein
MFSWCEVLHRVDFHYRHIVGRIDSVPLSKYQVYKRQPSFKWDTTRQHSWAPWYDLGIRVFCTASCRIAGWLSPRIDLFNFDDIGTAKRVDEGASTREQRLGIDLYSLTARERIFKMFIYNGGGVHLSIKRPIAQILDSNHISPYKNLPCPQFGPHPPARYATSIYRCGTSSSRVKAPLLGGDQIEISYSVYNSPFPPSGPLLEEFAAGGLWIFIKDVNKD